MKLLLINILLISFLLNVISAVDVSNYAFGYSVYDKNTGDIKTHHEIRQDNTVIGEYTLIDPDGYKRIVKYHANNLIGFNAIVKRKKLKLTKIPFNIPLHADGYRRRSIKFNPSSYYTSYQIHFANVPIKSNG